MKTKAFTFERIYVILIIFIGITNIAFSYLLLLSGTPGSVTKHSLYLAKLYLPVGAMTEWNQYAATIWIYPTSSCIQTYLSSSSSIEQDSSLNCLGNKAPYAFEYYEQLNTIRLCRSKGFQDLNRVSIVVSSMILGITVLNTLWILWFTLIVFMSSGIWGLPYMLNSLISFFTHYYSCCPIQITS